MHPCGLHFIVGKKGGGKSMLATKLAAGILRDTNRHLITNLPLRIPELTEYIYGPPPEPQIGQITKPRPTLDGRITFLTEKKHLKRFWLCLGNGFWIPDLRKEDYALGRELDFRLAYRWRTTTGPVRHRKLITDLYDDEIAKWTTPPPDQPQSELEIAEISDLPPVQFIIDEIQLIFPARGFMQTSQGAIFWLSQQRKLGADLICITQSASLVDKEFRDLADDWLYITNWGRKQKSWFRLPKVMTWCKYDQQPGPGISPMVSGTFRMDIEGIGQCYETAAGVGIEGSMDADKNERTPGIHWSWAFLAVAILLLLVFQIPNLITKGIQHLVMHSPTAVYAKAAPTLTTNQPPTTQTVAHAVAPRQAPPAAKPSAALTLKGVTVWRGIATAYLSDGTQVTSRQFDRFQGVIRDGPKIIGVRLDGRALYVQ